MGSLLFLIGPRCTGKTTVARLLAARLGRAWCDADQVLEERWGRTIRQIFAEEGEAHFRDKEGQILRELSERQGYVIATGGGVVLRPENRVLLRKGKVVWLTGDAEILWERLQKDATSGERRPNLAQGGLEEIQEVLRQRAPLYAACADLMLDTAGRTPEEIADTIVRWLGENEDAASGRT